MTAVRRVAGVLAVGVAGAVFAAPARAADPARVNAAITRGVDYLRKNANPGAGYNGGVRPLFLRCPMQQTPIPVRFSAPGLIDRVTSNRLAVERSMARVISSWLFSRGKRR